VRLIGATLNFLCLCVFFSARANGQILNGRVVEASDCAGIPGLTVRLTPPKGAQDNTELISYTDSEGRFRAGIQGRGRFYLKIAQGLTQVYGEEIEADPGRQILIALRKTAQETFSPLCLQGNTAGQFLHNVRPIGLALLSSGMLVLDGQDSYSILWQAQPAGFVKLQELNERAVDVASAKTNDGEVICILTNPIVGGVLTLYTSGMRQKKQWRAPGMKPFTGIAVVASQTAYVVVADDGSGRSFAIRKVDLNSSGSESQEVARLSGPDRLSVGPLAVDVQRNRLFAVDGVRGALYQVDLSTKQSREILVTSRLQQPRALALDAEGENLYVATLGHVWKIQLAASPMVRDFARPNLRFRLPAALAIGQDGNVWVGDPDAHAIHLLTPAGQLVGSVR
jgi:hypothetical protein